MQKCKSDNQKTVAHENKESIYVMWSRVYDILQGNVLCWMTKKTGKALQS